MESGSMFFLAGVAPVGVFTPALSHPLFHTRRLLRDERIQCGNIRVRQWPLRAARALAVPRQTAVQDARPASGRPAAPLPRPAAPPRLASTLVASRLLRLSQPTRAARGVVCRALAGAD